MTTFAEPEAVIRAWGRDAITSAAGRVFFSFPDNDQPPYPLVLVNLVAGPSDSWGTEALVQFDVFAEERADAAACAAELQGLLETLNQQPPTVAGIRLWGAYNIQLRRFYQDNDPLRRYIVEAVISLRRVS